ncbi:Caltractin like [Actinidia chinensis var. chinensis]|uniref:Caltractin like n=1 Tax=Actinidia chinensis var. chinensis TaxID=1590841 RepID=A0A2R6PVV3_ACTCC|nr:Caltractin like [Actinidia chinensis var. chinensis]
MHCNSPMATSCESGMEELLKTAQIYYKSSSTDLKEKAHKFFKSLDFDGNEKVSLHEFLGFMREEGHKKMSNRHFFKELDKDGSGTLEFMEVMTLYYILKSGRPFCEGCDTFIPGMFFTCTKCYENSPNSFSVCPDCYNNGQFIHDHKQFLDNYALLEAKRKEAIAIEAKRKEAIAIEAKRKEAIAIEAKRKEACARQQYQPKSSVTITELPKFTSTAASTSNALVAYSNPPKPKWKNAFKVIEIALVSAAGNLCNIM